jgi:hypothetical protein
VSGMPDGVFHQFTPSISTVPLLRQWFIDSIDYYNEDSYSEIEVRKQDTIVFQGEIETWDISTFLQILQEGDTIHINIK